MAEKMAVGKYEIIEKIKEGGMGTIYKAVHPTLGKEVILKELTLGSSHILIERFKREAKIMINLRNDYIVPVHDHFKDSHSYYLVMEYVDGISLEDLLKKYRRLKAEAALIIVYQVCKGLKYAHDKGIVHRDIKPDNILISKTGEIKIVDFGIATAFAANDEDLTKTGAVMGTPAYMSPEQLTDSKNVDKQADIYALGVVLYQMLTGKRPFASNFAAETIQKIKKGKYERPSKTHLGIPAVCSKIVKKMMHHRKRRRYQDLSDVLDRFNDLLHVKKMGKSLLRYLKSYLSAGDSICPVNLKKTQFARRSSMGTVLALMVLVLGTFTVFNSGLAYKVIQSAVKGNLELNLNQKNFQNMEQTLWKAELYKQFGTAGSSPGLLKFSKAEKKYTWNTGNLDSGAYILTGRINDIYYYSNFYVYPYKIEQKKNRILIPDLPITREPVSIHVRDIMTKQSISSFSKLVKKDGIWSDLEDSFKLETGVSYEILIRKEKYYDYLISYTHSYGRFYADVGLIPRPGVLLVDSNSDGMQIFIDGNSGGFSGKENKMYKNYGTTSRNTRTLFLPAGTHKVTIKKGNKTEKTVTITLNHLQNIRLLADYKETTGELQLREEK